MKTLYAYLLAAALPLAAAPVALGQQAPAARPHRAALLRVGIGPALLGTGDYACVKTHLEYAPQFGQHLRLGSRVAYIGGNRPYVVTPDVSVPQSYRAFNLEQEAFWLPFGANQPVEFGIGGGVFGGYTRQLSISQAGYDYINSHLLYAPRYDEGFHAGFIASANVDFAYQQWRLGGRASVQSDTFGNVLPSGQLVVSHAF